MTIDQQVMDQLIAASIGPAMTAVMGKPQVGGIAAEKLIAQFACLIAEAVYAQREKCINERAVTESEEKAKRQEKVRTSRIITMKPDDMTGGMP